jgi:hypothetical protein
LLAVSSWRPFGSFDGGVMAKFLGLAEQSVHIVPYAPPHGGFRHHHLCLNDTRFADQAFEQEFVPADVTR